jgi:hypothetical protein
VSGPQLELFLGATTETPTPVPVEPEPLATEVPNTSSDALYRWLRSPAGGAHGVKVARMMVAEARATLPTGENTVPRAARIDCDVSERCSFRALHRCPSCLFAICNNHAKQGSELRGEPPNRKCGKCGSLFRLPNRGRCEDACCVFTPSSLELS